MLKINKILSKKIKFPLSLRGAKQRNNLSGFSLIELMVAIAILAMAIFGIFHAYSAGFMGMADARDRTVATNYAREAMEDIKNKDFDQIITQSRNYIDGTKYEREVIVQKSTNLKKVTTKVYWKDRKGNTKTVETDTDIYFIETTAGAAIKIMLYANPYNVLTKVVGVPIGDTDSTITAVVKDNKGNTVTTWTGDITFSITSGSGSFATSNGDTSIIIPITTEKKGIASTTFYASGEEGTVIITALATDLTSDSVSIQVTNPNEPVKINLDATKKFMTASVTSTSEITATIVDASGARVTDATNEISFSVSGPGTLSAPTTTPAEEGIATITLTSNGTKGTITITASSSGLVPDFVTVVTGGKIDLFASVSSVARNEKATIGITTKDVNGLLINYIGDITLSVIGYEEDPGDGTLSSYSVSFDGDTYLETVDFTAESEGKVIITATDEGGILDSGELILTITLALVPHHIDVSAEPLNIKADGSDTSTITAVIKTSADDGNRTVTSYTWPVTFNIIEGDTTFLNGFKYDTIVPQNGEASVVLNPSVNIGTATIEATSDILISGSVEVGFYSGEDHIELSAYLPKMLVNGDTCTVTATVVDEGGTTVDTYNEDITFTILVGWPKIAKFATTGTKSLTTTIVEGGEISVILISQDIAGTVTLKAASFTGMTDIWGYLNIPVVINLELAPDPNIIYGENQVSFYIEVQVADLILEEMQVSWLPDDSETLSKIEINPNSTGIPVIYPDTYTPISSGGLIDVIDSTLSTGVSNVKLYFDASMSGKTLEVIFNPNSGNYSVTITEPTT